MASGVKTAIASSRKSAIKITGNSNANSIVGGKGADTLIGGKGNDTLTGGNGKDVFVYNNGDGNDVITDYSSSDKIKIVASSYSTLESGDDIVVQVGSGKITLKDAIGEDLNITRSSSFMEIDLDSILCSDSKLISNEYNYDTSSTPTKQLNQTLVSNSIKQSK